MKKCRLCKETKVELLIDFGKQPIVHHLLKNKDDDYDEYPFELGFCSKCLLIQLMNPILPSILYENYFTVSSWKNQSHIERFIDVMSSVTGINKNTQLLEIGCNDGIFLESLHKHGVKKCIGIEPSKDAYEIAVSKGLFVCNEFFTLKNRNLPFNTHQFDCIITRNVLEHISDLEDFMLSVYRYLKDDGFLIIEVPDTSVQLEYMDYALWEEHVNYFTLNTLRNLLKKFDFGIIHHEVTLVGGRSITVFAEKRSFKSSTDNINYFINDINNIQSYGKKWKIFKDRMSEFILSKHKPVIYGCGARSSTFVNFLDLDNIVCFIDDQIEKQNYFVPGKKIEILPWNDHYLNNDILIGVNTENEMKIINKRKLSSDHYFSILPPSRLLPSLWKEMIIK